MRKSFRDPITNVLKAQGFVTSNSPGDIAQDESDTFNLKPGTVQWNGSAWIAYAKPAPTDAEQTAEGGSRFDGMDKSTKAALLLLRNYTNAIVAGTHTNKTLAQLKADFITAYKAIS